MMGGDDDDRDDDGHRGTPVSLGARMRVDPTVDGTNNEIADFLQGSGALNARAVPEPGTWLTMLLGFAFVGGVIRSSKRRNRALSTRTA